MKELKFRAFNKQSKKIINWKELFSFKSVCGLFDNDNLEIMQYTGVKDKTGGDIYEGDIINCQTISDKNLGWKVIFNQGICAFQLKSLNDDEYSVLSTANCLDMEVVGNIYQNKELFNR